MVYRQSAAYAAAVARANADRARQKGTRGILANVGCKPLSLRSRVFAAVECAQ